MPRTISAATERPDTSTAPTTTAIVRSAPWWMWCGLAIVVRYVVLVSVASHRGGLSVDSGPNSGTAMHVYLPRMVTAADREEHRGNGNGASTRASRQPYAR